MIITNPNSVSITRFRSDRTLKLILYICLFICSVVAAGCASVYYVVSTVPGENLRTTAELMSDAGNKKVNVSIVDDTVLTGTLVSIENDSTLLSPPKGEELLLIPNEIIGKISWNDPSKGILEGSVFGAVVGLLLYASPEESGAKIGTGLNGFLNIFIPSIGIGAVLGAIQGHTTEYYFHPEPSKPAEESDMTGKIIPPKTPSAGVAPAKGEE
jgi:hypothetical protein